MGAHDWRYFVPFQADIGAALESLRQREFAARRYYTDEFDDPDVPAKSIEDALERSGASGTRSVLDMARGISPSPQTFCVSPLGKERHHELFGTDKPTRKIVEQSCRPRFVNGKIAPNPFDQIERGQGVYVIVYDDTRTPSEIFFAGYSFD